MDTFGDRFKHEREEYGLTRQALARILRVDQDHVRALECNDFEALPNEAVVTDLLRAYADRLNVDADLMIEDYVQEREKCLSRLAEAIADPHVETPPVATPTRARRPRLAGWLIVALILAAVVTLSGWWMPGTDPAGSTSPQPVAGAAAESRAASSDNRVDRAPFEAQATSSDNRVESTPIEIQPAPVDKRVQVAETVPQPATPTKSGSSTLSIPDFGVGTGVENRQLVGRADRFTEGTRVWFWTRVEGANAGQRIDHVWLRDGVEAARVSLELGGPRWRTHSVKMLHPGSSGEWAVEARDAAGHTLARRRFVAVP